MEAGTQTSGMEWDQDKTDFLNLIERSFRLLEKTRDIALSASNSTQGSIKSNDSSGNVTKSESVGGTENGRTRLLVVG